MTVRRGVALAPLLLAAICLACLRRDATDVPSGGGASPVAPAPAVPRSADEPRDAVQPEAVPASPAPRLLPDPASEPTQPTVDGLVTQVRELLATLADRTLTAVQRDERDAGVAFLAQVAEALEAGETERATMLAEKARILIEDLERATRP